MSPGQGVRAARSHARGAATRNNWGLRQRSSRGRKIRACSFQRRLRELYMGRPPGRLLAKPRGKACNLGRRRSARTLAGTGAPPQPSGICLDTEGGAFDASNSAQLPAGRMLRGPVLSPLGWKEHAPGLLSLRVPRLEVLAVPQATAACSPSWPRGGKGAVSAQKGRGGLGKRTGRPARCSQAHLSLHWEWPSSPHGLALRRVQRGRAPGASNPNPVTCSCKGHPSKGLPGTLSLGSAQGQWARALEGPVSQGHLGQRWRSVGSLVTVLGWDGVLYLLAV